MIKKGFLFCCVIICCVVHASSKQTTDATQSVSKIDLDKLPIHVTLYTNGAAKAYVTVGKYSYITKRTIHNDIETTEGLTTSQMLTMLEAIEFAYKKANFRADKSCVKPFDGSIHSQWIKNPKK